MTETPKAYGTPCEVLNQKGGTCGRPSTYRYEAMAGGYMHLCEHHGVKHAAISEHVSGSIGHIAQREYAKRAAEREANS